MHIITGNSRKLAEIQHFLPDILQLDIDLPEIQSTDPREVIDAKLTAAAGQVEGDYIVEDTSLYFDCLNGLPGPLIKWFIQKLGNEGLADLASKYEDQKAQAITLIGYYSAGTRHFFEGSISGTIVSPRGGGFSWDSIFQPDGYDKTFSEMSPDEKNAISMRGQAVRKLQTFLKSAE